MDRSDFYHQSAKALWPALLEDAISLQTSNYVVSETLSLIQYRLGYKAASLWYKDILGVLEVHWVKQATKGRCKINFYNFIEDCISFVIMHQNQIEKAFCFKRKYALLDFSLIVPLV